MEPGKGTALDPQAGDVDQGFNDSTGGYVFYYYFIVVTFQYICIPAFVCGCRQ
jgi:hypothetical protein